MDALWLREQFPVFEEIAYLNAGSCGPLPAGALRAGADEALAAATQGRHGPYFAHIGELREQARGHYAAAIGAQPSDVALTIATSDGMVRVLTGMGLQRGDEVLTAEGEHPGLLGPLAAARAYLGITVRTAPLARIHEAVTSATKLVACSHVAWSTGEIAPRQLADVGRDLPVLLDGAQGAGAIAVNPESLGCAFYAAAGQKWLCGPVGTGLLWVSPAWRDRLTPVGPTYTNLVEPAMGLQARPWPDARAFDAAAFSSQTLAAVIGAAEVLGEFGWPALFERATTMAASFAERLTQAGHTVAPRGASTLVSWESPDPEQRVAAALDAGVVLRSLPGTPYVRASIGAFNDEADLERALAVA